MVLTLLPCGSITTTIISEKSGSNSFNKKWSAEFRNGQKGQAQIKLLVFDIWLISQRLRLTKCFVHSGVTTKEILSLQILLIVHKRSSIFFLLGRSLLFYFFNHVELKFWTMFTGEPGINPNLCFYTSNSIFISAAISLYT